MTESQRELVDKAREAEGAESANPDRVIDAWRRAIAADPEGVARAAEHAGDPAYLAGDPRQAA